MRNREYKAFFSGSLFKKLLTSYLWLIVLPVILIGWISFKASEEILLTKISESNKQTIIQIEHNIKTLQDQATAIVNMITLNISLEPHLKETRANPYEELTNRTYIEQNMLQASLAFDWMQFDSFIVGTNGQVYTQNEIGGGYYTDRLKILRNNPNLRQRKDQIWWSGSQTSLFMKRQNEHVINASKLLINPYTLQEYGLFVLSVREESLKQIYKDSIGLSGSFYIIDRDGRYVTHSQQELTGQEVDAKTLQQLAAYKHPGDVFSFNDHTTITTVRYLEALEWMMVRSDSVESLFKEVTGLSRLILLMTVSLVIVSIVAAVWISRRIAMPLIRLNQRLQTFKLTGVSAASARVPTGVNELALLTTEYEQMIMKLEQTVHALVLNQEGKRQAELHALQAQINPHFLYNTLNSIKCLVWIDKTELIEPTINSFVKLLQMTIQRKDDEITLREEYACLEHYAYIQEIRLARSIKLRAFVSEEIWQYRIPKLLLQPIVENAIFHGIERMPEDTEAIISVYAASYHDDIRIEIADNGVGMNNAEEKEKRGHNGHHQFSGIGMSNVHERLQMNYGEQYGLSVRSKPGQGTTVTLTLPKRTAELRAKGEEWLD